MAFWQEQGGVSTEGRYTMKAMLQNGNRRVYVWRTGLCFLAMATVVAAIPLGFGSALASDGELVWAERGGGSGFDNGSGIVTLSDGSTLTTGRFQGSATFGQGEVKETTLHSAGSHDIFVAKYAADGTLDWAKRAGGTELDEGYGIATLPADGSAVVTGFFQGTATFGPGEANETTFTSTVGSYDIFVAQYALANGALIWAAHAGGADFDVAYGIAALSDGSVLITGRFQGTIIFAPGKTVSSAGFRDVFVAKYDPAVGTWVWATSAGGTGSADSDEGLGISALADGSSIVTGYFEGTAVFGAGEANETTLVSIGSHDVFVAKYNPDGSLAWAVSAGGTGIDEGSGVATLSDGTAVVTGPFCNAATFGLGETNEITLTSAGLNDIFVAKYNGDGTLAWARSAGGASAEAGYGVAALSDDTAVVTGSFYDTVTFGLGEANETALVSAGSYDVFVARYNGDGTLAWARSAGGADSDEGFGISTAEAGNAFVTGYFESSGTFGSGEAKETVLDSDGYTDVFVAEFEALPLSGGELEVEIDIKPGAYPNIINLSSHGLIPVAILSSAEFDATEVDPATVSLSGSSVAIRGKGDRLLAHTEDVNGDGLMDLVVNVETENLNPDELQDGYAWLTGETYDGVPVVGCDEITIIPVE